MFNFLKDGVDGNAPQRVFDKSKVLVEGGSMCSAWGFSPTSYIGRVWSMLPPSTVIEFDYGAEKKRRRRNVKRASIERQWRVNIISKWGLQG